ncbi:uncharacterized protein F5Z01DRAFT_649964 [Emericellopsis atlantica]|uniref:Zn(2)-C6 fungal-type domain-containing protein n=1 Tax=Emericellopsis atlantica TaxID=2614577 RepID=A0A9P8CT20_9HYPO|nr:uncharacterized protein F5Z01DRAFT_649964 [Emericellopsis atlantica]KAG9256366.1 hypothetical protein F5Z01DRAFT_649964 [Emericellopsis atlantica]
MRAKRSRAGCSQCRRLRIKCDEQYPTCRECVKRDRVCNLSECRFRSFEPQSDTRSESAMSRVADGPDAFLHARSHRFKTSKNASSQSASHSISRKRSDRPSSPEEFDVGSESTTSNTAHSTTPGGRTRLPYGPEDLEGPDDIAATFNHPQADAPNRVDQPWTCGSPLGGSPTWRLPQPKACYPVDTAVTNTKNGSPIANGLQTSEERAFFLRHFSNTPGKWMDLFDQDCFYSRQVPILALSSPLIMSSACAFAARQLSLTVGRQPPPSPYCTATQSHADNMQKRDYAWFAEAYYDAAISLLRQHTSDVAAQGQTPVVHTGTDAEAPIVPRARVHDEVVVAVTILSNYEFLGGVAPNWSSHLDGARSFLRLADEAGFLDFAYPSPTANSSPGPLQPLRHAFWNFVRQDMLSALIHGRRTRVEMDDIAMWRRMGLNLDPNGRVADLGSASQQHDSADRVDMISNTLVWLLAKLVNFLATSNDEVNTWSNPAESDAMPETDTFRSKWFALKDELQLWFDTLPPIFQPCSRVSLPNKSSSRSSSCQCRAQPLIDHETWYSDNMCASSMQSYYMAHIILLLHKPRAVSVRQLPWASGTQPTGRSRFPDTLADLNQMNEMLQYFAVEICAIALSRPEEAARVHMLQPLYLAGRCLTGIMDRGMVVQLIDSIEDELGWHAKYRVDALLEEWDLTREALVCCHGTA